MDIQSVDAGLLSITRDTKGTGKYFIYGEKVIWDTTITPVTCKGFIEKIFEYDGNVNLTEIFSSPNESRFVNQISGRVYFTSSGKSNIWKYMNGKFEVWKDFSSTGYQIGTIWGRSEADIFCWSSFNKNYNISILSHYNGTDLQPLYQADNFNNARIIGDDVFVIIEGKTRGIAHGRLKNN
jgi:hypothetical protein